VNFEPLFKPRSMAVIGVSLTNDRHPANVIYNKTHLRYPIRVYPVNPRGGVLQRETVYRSIGALPEAVDHAVIAARAEFVPEIVAECIAAGVGGATVISGGFAERQRDDLQQSIATMAREAAFPLVGPNCLGIYVPSVLDTFFLPTERLVRPEPGRVALVSQSGGVLVDQMVKFAGQGVGLSMAVSIGNKAVIREIELLRYLLDDSATSVIAFYVEGFGRGEGRQFVLEAAQSCKPVVILKAGKSHQGSRAVSSHTASLAGNYAVFSQVMAQHGIVEAKNELELVAFCESLSCYQNTVEGRVGIITISGGHGALASDACVQQNLMVPPLSESDRSTIRANLAPRLAAIAGFDNPIDMTGSAVDDDFFAAANSLAQISDIDCILLLLLPYSPGITADLGARLSQVQRQSGKPLVAYVPHVEKYRMLIEGFELNRIPVSSSIEGAVLMVAALRRCRPC